jgi:hypothetical protein
VSWAAWRNEPKDLISLSVVCNLVVAVVCGYIYNMLSVRWNYREEIGDPLLLVGLASGMIAISLLAGTAFSDSGATRKTRTITVVALSTTMVGMLACATVYFMVEILWWSYETSIDREGTFLVAGLLCATTAMVLSVLWAG